MSKVHIIPEEWLQEFNREKSKNKNLDLATAVLCNHIRNEFPAIEFTEKPKKS